MNNAPPQSATGFWSIERFVAFVLGPAVTAGSGWLSLFLAKKFGINIGGAEITGIFATGGLAAGGLAYKWLHGRQLESSLLPVVEHIEGNPLASNFIHTTITDLEGLAQSAAKKAVQTIVGASPPIPPAEGDPAPASGAEGAASGQ